MRTLPRRCELSRGTFARRRSAREREVRRRLSGGTLPFGKRWDRPCRLPGRAESAEARMGVSAEPFDRLDTLTPAALRRWWTRRARRVLEIAFAELPFYRERFAAERFDVSSFRTLADLSRLPTFRKQDMLAWQGERRSHR